MVNVSNTVQLITPDQSIVWLGMRYEHQRKVSNFHVDALARAMYDGTFSPVSTIMFAVLRGKHFLINGQHTLSAIVKSKVSQTLPVAFYTVDSEKEIGELYFRIDRQRKRNMADSIRVTDLPELTGLTPTAVKITMGALRHIAGNFGANHDAVRRVSDDDLLSWMPNWAWEANAVRSAISPCGGFDRRMVEQQAVFCVAIVTMRYQTKMARDFWRQVAQDDGLERYDPRKALRNYLQRARLPSGGGLLRAHEVSRGVILAWNAYFEKRTLRFVLPRDITSPVKILGTVFSGVQAGDFMPLYPSPALEQARLDAENHTVELIAA